MQRFTLLEVHSKKIIKDLFIDYANRLLPGHSFVIGNILQNIGHMFENTVLAKLLMLHPYNLPTKNDNLTKKLRNILDVD